MSDLRAELRTMRNRLDDLWAEADENDDVFVRGGLSDAIDGLDVALKGLPS